MFIWNSPEFLAFFSARASATAHHPVCLFIKAQQFADFLHWLAEILLAVFFHFVEETYFIGEPVACGKCFSLKNSHLVYLYQDHVVPVLCVLNIHAAFHSFAGQPIL